MTPPAENLAGPDLANVDLLLVLQALSDPVRLEMVRQLALCPRDNGIACGQLDLPVAKSTVSHHLRVLHDAGVIAYEEQGTRKLAHLRKAELGERFPGVLESVIRSTAVPDAAGLPV